MRLIFLLISFACLGIHAVGPGDEDVLPGKDKGASYTVMLPEEMKGNPDCQGSAADVRMGHSWTYPPKEGTPVDALTEGASQFHSHDTLSNSPAAMATTANAEQDYGSSDEIVIPVPFSQVPFRMKKSEAASLGREVEKARQSALRKKEENVESSKRAKEQ